MSVRVWGVGVFGVSLSVAALAVGLGCDSIDKLPGALKAPKDPVKDPTAKDPTKKPDPVAKADTKTGGTDTKTTKTGGTDTKTGAGDTKTGTPVAKGEPKAEPKTEPTAPPEPMITDAPPATVDKEQWAKTHAIAKVGDVMVYETVTAGFEQKEQIEVTDVTADSVTALITTTMKIQGVPPQKKRQKYVIGEPSYSMKTVDDKVKFKDKEYDGKRTDMTISGTVYSKTWAAPKDIPLGGTVKAEDKDGKATYWLTDFGRGAEAPAGTPDKSSETRGVKSAWSKANPEGAMEAKVGDWIETEYADGSKIRFQVLEVGENSMTTLMTTTAKDGKKTTLKSKAVYDLEPEKLKVGDAEISADKMEVSENGKPTMTQITSKDVPLDATVLMQTDNAGQKYTKKLVSLKRGK